MKVQILGTGCAKCNKLENNAKEAVENIGKEIEIIKINNLDQIINMGVMITPALAIDNNVKSVGKLLTKEEIIKLIEGEL